LQGSGPYIHKGNSTHAVALNFDFTFFLWPTYLRPTIQICCLLFSYLKCQLLFWLITK